MSRWGRYRIAMAVYLPASEHIWLVLASMYEFGGGFGSVTEDNWSKNTIIRSLFFKMNGLTTSMYCSWNIVRVEFSFFLLGEIKIACLKGELKMNEFLSGFFLNICSL